MKIKIVSIAIKNPTTVPKFVRIPLHHCAYKCMNIYEQDHVKFPSANEISDSFFPLSWSIVVMCLCQQCLWCFASP